MDTTTLIFVIIGAFTVSSWFMRLVDYLEGGKERGEVRRVRESV